MLEILNINNLFWTETTFDYENELVKTGYTLFKSDTETRRIAYSNGFPQIGFIEGFVKISDVPPTTGFTNNGSDLQQKDDSGLAALSEAYGLDWTDGDGNMIPISYETISKYVLNPSGGLIVENYIKEINLINQKQLLNNNFISYNGLYYLRDMIGTSDVQIKNTRVLTFNGINQYATCGDLGDIPEYAIEIVFISSEIVNYRNVFDTNYGSNDGIRVEQQTGNRLTIRVGNATGVTGIVWPEPIYEGVKYTLLISTDGVDMYLKLNGVKYLFEAPYIADSFANLIFGGGFASSRAFKGSISSLKIWKSNNFYNAPKENPTHNYTCKENGGSIVYNASGDVNHATIVGYNEGMWEDVSDEVEQPLFILGYQAYEDDFYPQDKTKYRFIPYVGGMPITPIISGFTWKYNVDGNLGISDVGCYFSGIKLSDGDLNYNEVVNAINSIPPASDFRVTEKDGIFTDWAVQPYEQKFYSDGAAAYTSDGKEEWAIKTFE